MPSICQPEPRPCLFKDYGQSITLLKNDHVTVSGYLVIRLSWKAASSLPNAPAWICCKACQA